MFVFKMGFVDFEDLIWNVFICFDEDCDGVLNFDDFKEFLMMMGLRLIE